jgi:hypothetical protein
VKAQRNGLRTRAGRTIRRAAPALLAVLAAAVGLAASSRQGVAQTTRPTRSGLRLPAPPTQEFAARGSRAAPGVSLGVPSGYGADFGDAAIGFGFQATTRLHDRPDGVAALAFGVGDARDLLGLEAVVTSYGTARTCCRGGLSLKLHRVLPADFGVAVGWENGAVWGGFDPNPAEETDAGRSFYGVASKVIHLRRGRADPYRTLTLTLGAGNGRFRSEDDIIDDHETVNLFGGAALRMSRATSVVADWTGQDLVAGFSLLPLRNRAVVLLPGVADITTKPRFIFGAAWGFDYTSIFR